MRLTTRLTLILAGCAGLAGGIDTRPADVRAAAGPASGRRAEAAAKMRSVTAPLAFEPNRGQTDERVSFLVRAPGLMAFVTPTETVLALNAAPPADDPDARSSRATAARDRERDVVRMRFDGANDAPAIEGRDEQPGRSNYFIGSDSSKWITDVPNFGGVAVRGIYPGVDLVWRTGADRRLTYDLVVAPGAEVSSVAMRLDGATDLQIGSDGGLRASTPRGELRHGAPFAYQTVDGVKSPVASAFVLASDGLVRFEVGAYDATRPLVIDPTLSYSTYHGGSNFENGFDIDLDGAGNVYVTGVTYSTNFPIAGSPFQGSLGGQFNWDAFATKFNGAGTQREYSTFFGGINDTNWLYTGDDQGFGIAVTSAGEACVVGDTDAAPGTFPLRSAAQSTYGGNYDGFAMMLNSSGSALAYATYTGGNAQDTCVDVAVDGEGNAYAFGRTQSTNFPTYLPLQSTNRGQWDCFIVKYSATGVVGYSTYLGGSGTETSGAIDVMASGGLAGSVYVSGTTSSPDFPTKSAFQDAFGGNGDAFLSRLNAAGSSLVFSTFLGGSNQDQGLGLAIDNNGAAFVCGDTRSNNFPTTPNVFRTARSGTSDAFVTKFCPSGASLIYSTYLGGSNLELAYGVAVDSGGAAKVVGTTNSINFPTVQPTQATNGAGYDAFVTQFTADGSGLDFSTYLGGQSTDEARRVVVDSTGAAFVTGTTRSTNFPAPGGIQILNGGDRDAFVTKYTLSLGAGGADCATPRAPINLTATYAPSSGVVLRWTDLSSDETGFRVQRKAEGFAFSDVTVTPADTTVAFDLLLYPSTTFTYRVQAINQFGGSDYSNEATITTADTVPLPPPPRDPSPLTATPGEGPRIDLVWKDNSTSEVKFEVQRGPAGGTTFRSFSFLPQNVTEMSDYDVHPGWPSSYRIRALSLQGASGWSNTATGAAPGTLDVVVSKGSLTNSTKPNLDKMTVTGTYAFVPANPEAVLDPVANGFSVGIGPSNGPILVSIPPDDAAWKVTKKGKATWKSAKGVLPKVTVVVDKVRSLFTVTLTGGNFEGAATTTVRVLLACGADGGAHSATWTERKAGVMGYKSSVK